MKFYIAGIGNFAFFLRKIVDIIIFCSHPKKDVPVLYAFKVLFYAESVDMVTSGNVTKMAVTPFDPQLPKTP